MKFEGRPFAFVYVALPLYHEIVVTAFESVTEERRKASTLASNCRSLAATDQMHLLQWTYFQG